MNEYRGKHFSSVPWAVSSTASTHYRSRHMKRNRRRKEFWIALAVLILVLLAAPFVDARILRVDQVRLTSEDLPGDIGRLRVVFLSDVHYGFHFSDAQVSSLISSINQLKPDLVLFGGAGNRLFKLRRLAERHRHDSDHKSDNDRNRRCHRHVFLDFCFLLGPYTACAFVTI